MPRSFFCHLNFLFGFIISGFGQEKKEDKPLSREPLHDSVYLYTKKGDYTKALSWAELC